MKNILPGCICAFLLPLHVLLAQQDTSAVLLKEIVVTANKPDQFAPGSRIFTIDSTDIDLYSQQNLTELLQMRTALYLKNYGNGMLSSISFRGTSAAHTAVLWNGFTLNQATLGEIDFSLIPTHTQSKIDIHHGPSATNYGTGAIGGAILLSDPFQWKKSFNVAIEQQNGSFGKSMSKGNGSYSNGRLTLQTSVYHSQSKNDFTYRNTFKANRPVERQENASFRQYGFTQNIGFKLSKKSWVGVRSWIQKNDRQIQPAIGSANTEGRQSDESIRLMTEWNTYSSFGMTSAKASYFHDKLSYSDNSIISNTLLDTYQGQLTQLVPLGKKVIIEAGGEAQHFSAISDGYGNKVTENRASAFMLTRYQPIRRVNISINARQAFIQKYNPPFTPSMGFQINLLENQIHILSLKGNISQSYRVPTLNERFWHPGGNPDIKPEKSFAYEAGIAYKTTLSSIQTYTEITYYKMRVKDWIQWQPASQGFWSPVNLLEVHPRGIEWSGKLLYRQQKTSISLNSTYSYTKSTIENTKTNTEGISGNQLMYVPLHNGNIAGHLNFRGFFINSNVSYTGYRYTTNSNSDWLEAFTLTNIMVGKILRFNKLELTGSAKISNLFNTVYQNLAYRAMPGRNYSIGLKVNFHTPLTN